MNRRSFIHTCCGGVVGVLLGRHVPAEGGLVKKPYPCLLEPGEVHLPSGWTRTVVAGEAIGAGEMVVLGEDGRGYRADRERMERHVRIAKLMKIKYTR